MTLQVWAQALPQHFAALRTYFYETRLDTPLTFVNPDLVGFFNSVPQERLLDAVSALVQEWRQQRSEFVISVDIFGKGRPTQTTFSGHHRRPAFHHKSLFI